MNTWLIGGVQFVPVGWDASFSGRDVDYELVPFESGLEAWSIRPSSRGSETGALNRARTVVVPVEGLSRLQQGTAIQESACRVLLDAGCLPSHGALITRQRDSPGVLILGDSGRGKSSIVWLAISAGWRVVSDDLIALRPTAGGRTRGAAIRKRLRIPAELVDQRTRSLGRRRLNGRGLRKVHIDPDAVRPGTFLREAEIDCVVFLETGSSRSVRPVSKTETLERLLASCAPALSSARTRIPFQTLAGLARHADAKVARLTKACLSDPGVLEELTA